MTSPGFVAVESPSASRLVLILPVKRQKVKGIGPGPFEIALGSREEEPAGTTNRTAIAARFRHNLDTSLQELQTQLVIPDIDHFILGLIAYRHRHNIQPSGDYLTVTISTIPTNRLFS